MSAVSESPATLYCTRHRERETLLRCGRCGRPFCVACLVMTTAGQRCHDCAGVRPQAPRRVRAVRALALITGISALVGALMLVLAILGPLRAFGLLGMLLIGIVLGAGVSALLRDVITFRTRRLLLPLAAGAIVLGGLAGQMLALVLFHSGTLDGERVLLALVAVALNWNFWLVALVASITAAVRLR